MNPNSFRIGLISDTHGLLRPEVPPLLAGCRTILHAGDVGKPEVLARLEPLAPVIAVRGNNDRGEWAERLPRIFRVTLGGIRLLMIHDLGDLDFDPAAAGFDVVVSGHSHRPHVISEPILFVNPGSAGPRRFKLPVSLGFLEISNGRVCARIQPLDL